MSWIPTTGEEQQEMLKTIGADSISALFDAIPAELRMKAWDVPPGISEMEVCRDVAELGGRNNVSGVCFLGGGYYDHYIPAAVDALSSRSEFYTAYTPYQPECSQGTLQSIYEYQSAICRLTNMEFANASLYDGSTAVFEAATMAVRVTRQSRVLLHDSLNPRYNEVLRTHVLNLKLDVEEVTSESITDEVLSGCACVIVQNPSFLGDVDDFTALAERCHAHNALLVVVFYPMSLGVLKTPGEMGADIAVAEGQSLGLPLGFGGPYLGILATRKAHVRKMPGRIAGETVDGQGRRGFVLTLQAREQHIRRDKAMSNICSNQALCALRALIFMCLYGKEGIREVSAACHAKAEYLKSRLSFVEQLNTGPTFNEFAVRLPRPAAKVVHDIMFEGYQAGLPLESVGAGGPNDLLIAVTEQRTRAEMDAFALTMERVLCS